MYFNVLEECYDVSPLARKLHHFTIANNECHSEKKAQHKLGHDEDNTREDLHIAHCYLLVSNQLLKSGLSEAPENQRGQPGTQHDTSGVMRAAALF